MQESWELTAWLTNMGHSQVWLGNASRIPNIDLELGS